MNSLGSLATTRASAEPAGTRVAAAAAAAAATIMLAATTPTTASALWHVDCEGGLALLTRYDQQQHQQPCPPSAPPPLQQQQPQQQPQQPQPQPQQQQQMAAQTPALAAEQTEQTEQRSSRSKKGVTFVEELEVAKELGVRHDPDPRDWESRSKTRAVTACFSAAARVRFLRPHTSDIPRRSISDLLSCRGSYFGLFVYLNGRHRSVCTCKRPVSTPVSKARSASIGS
jgi:hypothetical protein